MKILGIESSSTVASIAIVDNGILRGEYTINQTLKHSKTLMPMLEDMLKRLDVEPKEIDLIAVSEGPGSFTGLRIGSATAKGLAQGLSIPIASIPTMEVLASTVCVDLSEVHCVMYARAREVYYQCFDVDLCHGRYRWTAKAPIITCEIEAVVQKVKKESKTTFVIGDGVQKYPEVMNELKDRVTCLAPIYTNLSAKNVAILGQSRYDDRDIMTYQEHRPYYHKKSQAEREYESKHHGKS